MLLADWLSLSSIEVTANQYSVPFDNPVARKVVPTIGPPVSLVHGPPDEVARYTR